MAYKKGEKVEPGIWHLEGSRQYIVEVSYRDPETWQRVRKRQTFNRLELATSWRRKILDPEKRRELMAGSQARALTFSDFASDYLKHWSRERKPSTVYVETLRINSTLMPVFGHKAVGTISQRDVEAFLTLRRDSGVTAATTNRDLCRIKNIFRKAQEWGLVASNPATGIKQTKERIVEQDFLTEDEVACLIEACDNRLRPLVVTAVHTVISIMQHLTETI